jgi:prolipoprotein diacylglyceryltransferase
VLYERRRPQQQRPGRLFALYVAGYAVGRFWVEALRIDPASRLLGLRVNLWTSGVALAAAIAWLVVTRQRSDPNRARPTDDTPPSEDTSIETTDPHR